MPGTQMATNEQEAQPQDAPAPAPASDPGKAAFDAKLAELRGDGGGGKPAFQEVLESEGIDVEVKPKAEASPEPADAPSKPQPAAEAPNEAEGADALLDALTGKDPRGTREEHLEWQKDISGRAEEAGLPKEIAHALANNVPRKVAEQWLVGHTSSVKSNSAGQPSAPGAGVPTGAPATSASVEVQRVLAEEVGEETATAVARVIAGLEAQVAEARELAGFSAEATAASARERAQAQMMKAAGELSGQFPGLVRDGVLDAQVGQAAAALIEGGVRTSEDILGALEMAARAVLGTDKGERSSRQTSRKTSPDLDSPTGAPELPTRPLKPFEVNQRILQEMNRHSGKSPEERQPYIDKLVKRLRAHNERAQQR